MARLKFEDIDEWTPSSISIVDVPAHPLCQFEIYDDDEEFVKKSIEIDGEIMVEQNPQEEQMVSGPVSFFKDLLNRNVGKADEKTPVEPPKEEPLNMAELEARIEKLEKAVKELQKPDSAEEEKKEEGVNPTPEAVAKSEEDIPPAENEPKEIVEDAVSKSLDPDMISSETSEKSLLERTGRKSNGMTW